MNLASFRITEAYVCYAFLEAYPLWYTTLMVRQ